MVVTSEVSGFSDFAVVVQAPDPAFIDADPVERTVAENAVSGAAVGAPITATTPGGEALVYTLGGTDAASFAVDPATGQIRVGVGTVLDYEGDRKVYQVTVAAEDPSGAQDRRRGDHQGHQRGLGSLRRRRQRGDRPG